VPYSSVSIRCTTWPLSHRGPKIPIIVISPN
jgi:hypothetical protein